MANFNFSEQDIQSAIKSKDNKTVEKKKISTIDDLIKEIENIEKKYELNPVKGDAVDTELNLTKKEDLVIDNDKIKKLAENELFDYKKEKENTIKNVAEEKKSNVNKNFESLQDTLENQKKNIESNYNTAKQNAESDALKRGIGRSSIIINTLAAFDDKKIEEFNEIDKKLTESINSLNQELSALEIEKEQAINDFDLAYATKLNSKIDELTNELKSEQEKVLEYNNEIAQIEAEFDKKLIESNNDIENEYYQNLIKKLTQKGTNSVAIQLATRNEIAEVTKNFLLGLDEEEALKLIDENDYIQKSLGSTLKDVRNLIKA